MSFDDIYEYVGAAGTYQIVIFIFLSFVPLLAGINTMSMIFLGGHLQHWCKIDEIYNLSYDVQRKLAIPYIKSMATYSSCLYDESNLRSNISFSTYEGHSNTTAFEDVYNSSTSHCKSWNYDQSEFLSSTISEFNLVCNDSSLAPLASVAFLAGSAVANLVAGPLSDSLGRQTMLYVASVGYIPTGYALVYVQQYMIFVLLRFVLGVFNVMMLSSAYVLSIELFGTKYRALPGALYWFNFCLGFMLLCVIAYFIRDYRKLQICLATISLVTLTFFIVVPESPRWYFTKGRFKEAKKCLNSMAEVNQREFSENSFEKLQNNINMLQNAANKNTLKREKAINTASSSMLLVTFKSKIIRRRICILIPAWISIALMYFGLSLNTSNLEGNLYIVTFVSGLVEIPAEIAGFVLMYQCSHKLTVIISTIVSAVLMFINIALIYTRLDWLVTAISLLAKGTISLAFVSVETFTLQLFPTVARQYSYSLIKSSAYMGSIIAPYTGNAMMNVWRPLPLVIFGTTGLISALLLLMLPDTFQKPIPDTLEDLRMPKNEIEEIEETMI